MGGNALKNYETRRLSVKDFLVMDAEVHMKLRACIPGIEAETILYYKNKDSFGDLDIIVMSETLPVDWEELVIKEFDLSEAQFDKNSNVLSIGWKNFQIDLITTREIYYHTSLQYFAYNDLGNLLGRICHKLGIKYGHKGLSLVIRHKDASDHILDEIELTNSSTEVFDILGLDYQTFLKGFNDLEDIFKFVASSKYFDPEIFSLDNRNATSRVRDKKRVTYTKFLKWCEDTKPETKYRFERKTEIGGYSLREPYYHDIVLVRWPWVKDRVDMLIEVFEFEKTFMSVYNGNIVGTLTGLSGKDLGIFMSKAKPYLDRATKEEFIRDPEKVVPFVLGLYKSC